MIDDSTLIESLEEARAFLEERFEGFQPEVGLILGSGLGPFADCIECAVRVPFAAVPHMGTASAAGHVGQFVAGYVAGRRVLAMQGRLHGYEGFSAQEVAFPVWLMGALGVHTLITTNAAGAINCDYGVGDFCAMRDHINFTGRNPLCGKAPDEMAPRFLPMLDAYDSALRERILSIAADLGITVREGVYLGLLGPSFETPAEIRAFRALGAYDSALRERILSIAADLGITVREGVYLGLLGPSFETPAEIRAFRALGADTVAMSVCEEVIAARHCGMRVAGLSLVSNMACGIEGANPSDDEVYEVAATRLEDFSALITRLLADETLNDAYPASA